MKKALTIAGSDPGGGAGIQADLKTFCARGVFGMSVIAALTAQNTTGVQGVLEIPPDFVALQLDSVIKDIGTDAVKIGMLSNANIIKIVAEKIQQYHLAPVVVDPVMVAKGGDLLLREDASSALIKVLLPKATVVTPNLPEAAKLCGFEIKTLDEMRHAARLIHDMGPTFVIVKGGHLAGEMDAIDLLFDGEKFETFASSRISTKNDHGTGCTFSSAIAAELAKGVNIRDAVGIAKEYLTRIMAASADLKIGSGHGPMNHTALLVEKF